MSIVTLTSDWQLDDYYLGAIKGKLLTMLPSVNVIDIAHQIKSFDYIRAAFILKHAYPHFPEGTVHIICINSEEKKDTPHIAVYHQGQYFISADNEILGLIFDEVPSKMVYLEHSAKSTFPELDVFVYAAVHIVSGGSIDELGTPYLNLKRPTPIQPFENTNTIIGHVIYIDSFGNLITNISRKYFYNYVQNHRFEILLKKRFYSITSISKNYTDIHDMELVAIFNSLNLLEIAFVYGNAAELLNIRTKEEILIKIIDT